MINFSNKKWWIQQIIVNFSVSVGLTVTSTFFAGAQFVLSGRMIFDLILGAVFGFLATILIPHEKIFTFIGKKLKKPDYMPLVFVSVVALNVLVVCVAMQIYSGNVSPADWLFLLRNYVPLFFVGYAIANILDILFETVLNLK